MLVILIFFFLIWYIILNMSEVGVYLTPAALAKLHIHWLVTMTQEGCFTSECISAGQLYPSVKQGQ